MLQKNILQSFTNVNASLLNLVGLCTPVLLRREKANLKRKLTLSSTPKNNINGEQIAAHNKKLKIIIKKKAHEGSRRAVLISALVTATGSEGQEWSCIRED